MERTDRSVKLYFIRHGKTQWNLEGRFQGAGGDSPLLDESYQQMIQVGQFLRQTPFVHAYASPIKRARITAQRVIKELHQSVPLTLLNRLEEFHLGKMEGMAFSAVKDQYPAELDAFRNHPERYDARTIGGETRNTSVTVLETTDGQSFKLIDWNDTSFLTATATPTDTI
ncbi:histidine phosphatase family protein [Levilactobacillus brevis]|nr:histidine phosphatase family protein [Levilactobacillus brevis]